MKLGRRHSLHLLAAVAWLGGCTVGEPLVAVILPAMDSGVNRCPAVPECPVDIALPTRTWSELGALSPVALSQCPEAPVEPCISPESTHLDAGVEMDAAAVDDGGMPDGASLDADVPEDAQAALDGAAPDAQTVDAGVSPDAQTATDAGAQEAGPDALGGAGAKELPTCDTDMQRLRKLADEPRACGEWSFELAPDEIISGGAVSLRGLELERVNLTLSSDLPVRVSLADVSFSNVFIALEGPVELSVDKSRAFEKVRVVGLENEAGPPQLELSRVEADQVRVGDLEVPFEGELTVRWSSVYRSGVSARDVLFESSTFNRGVMRASTLLALDDEFTQTSLAVGEAQIAASALDESVVEECGVLSVLGSKVKGSQFVACDPEPLRLYNLEVEGSMIDGMIDSTGTRITGSRFGVAQPTQLVSWSGSVTASNFCEHAERHQTGDTFVYCIHCFTGLTEPDAVCSAEPLPPPKREILASDAMCPAYAAVRECTEPVERLRPR